MTKEEMQDILHALGLDYEAEPTLIYLFYVTPAGEVNNFSISVSRGSHMSDRQLEALMRSQYPATRDAALMAVERPDPVINEDIEWIDVPDVCSLLHISVKTLRRWTQRGIFTPSAVGRRLYYKRAEVDRVIQEHAIMENGRLDTSAFNKQIEGTFADTKGLSRT